MNPSNDLYITKANFIQFRHQNIIDFYDFHPKVFEYWIIVIGKGSIRGSL